MNFAEFSDDEFDVKKWVNDTFNSFNNKNASNQKQNTKEKYATSLVMKLQMQTQEINNQLDDLCQQTVNNLPRVMRDLETIKQDSMILRDKMQSVKKEICKVECDTSQSMKTLLKLDTIKSRMNTSSAALQEDDNWSSLASDIEKVFLTNDIDAITKKLEGLQNSLQMLPDIDNEKSEFLSTLKNRLETLLSTKVIQAFSSNDLESTLKYYDIFKLISRTDEFRGYYNKCNKVALVEKWKTIQGQDGDISTDKLSIISNYFDYLAEFKREQDHWCIQVFGDAQITIDLLTEVMETVKIELFTDVSDTPASISQLIDARRVFDTFATEISNQTTLTLDNLYSLESLSFSIYHSLREHLYNFDSFAKSSINAKLKEFNFESCDIYECESIMNEAVSKVFDFSDKLFDDSFEVASGYVLPVLLKSYKYFFSEFACKFRRSISSLSQKYLSSDSVMLNANSVDIGEMTKEWGLFQDCVQLIQVTGKLSMRMQKLAKKLENEFNKYKPKSLTSLSPLSPSSDNLKNPFQDFWSLFVSTGYVSTESKLLKEWLKLIDVMENGGALLGDSIGEMNSLSACVHSFTFDLVTKPVVKHFDACVDLKVWISDTVGMALTSELPTFSQTPQEYITKVGQYLMTLPLHLEIFSAEEPNEPLCSALQTSKLPHYNGTFSTPSDNLTAVWMQCITDYCLQSYINSISKISLLSTTGAKQLVTDIDYITNVSEDLAMNVPSDFSEIIQIISPKSSTQSEEQEFSIPKPTSSVVEKLKKALSSYQPKS